MAVSPQKEEKKLVKYAMVTEDGEVLMTAMSEEQEEMLLFLEEFGLLNESASFQKHLDDVYYLTDKK